MSKNNEEPKLVENSRFKCKCGSNSILYTTDTTWDGADDIYYYHCQNCDRRWTVTTDYS